MNETKLLPSVIEIRRDIHENPETGFDVERTAGIAAQAMRRAGLEVREGVGRTGVVADLNVPGATRRVAFRADMDALPIQEAVESPFKSKVPGKAHLCGHDAHTAMLVGTAQMLAARREQLLCNVRFIFQPSEELQPGGAPGMIADGCLDGVDAIYGVHVWPWLECGSIGIVPGPMLAQADVFDITVEGKGGHAAAPHECVDPIVLASQLVCELQTLVSRVVSPFDQAVVSITEFLSGSSYNVIPAVATLRGTARSYSPNVTEVLKSGIQKMVSGRGTLTYHDGYPPLINPVEQCDYVAERAKRFLSDGAIVYPGKPAMFGEDFAYYLKQVPGCYIQLGCRNESMGAVYPLHHPHFSIDEGCMAIGMRLFSELL